MPTKPEPESNTGLSRSWNQVRAIMVVLTDLSFREFVTPKLIRLIYFISLIGAVLAALTWMVSGFATSMMYGFFTFATGPVAFFVYMLTARVVLEFMLAVFRIAENTEKLRDKMDR